MVNSTIRPLRIDVCALSRSAPASRRPHMVTRPTGRAVRKAIEDRLAASPPEGAGDPSPRVGRLPGRAHPSPVVVSVVDFTRVRVMDFSCADEVVAKLLLRYLAPDRPRNVFFLFRAADDTHRHAVEQVLERHGLAAVCDMGAGRFRLLGCASPGERKAWAALEMRRRIRAEDATTALGPPGARRLRRLAKRRLVYAEADGGVSALSSFATAGTLSVAEERRGAE